MASQRPRGDQCDQGVSGFFYGFCITYLGDFKLPPPPRFERPILESTLEVEDRVVSNLKDGLVLDNNGCFEALQKVCEGCQD